MFIRNHCLSFILTLTVFFSTGLFRPAFAVKIGQRLPNIQIRDAHNKSISVPYLGTHPLLIFYPDPDHPKCKFTDYLEEHPIPAKRMKAYGIVNMKDAPWYPNGIIRTAIRSKIKKTGQPIYTDPNRALARGWGLGDCNNKFVIIIVDEHGRLLWLHKGEPNEAAKREFWHIINRIKD